MRHLILRTEQGARDDRAAFLAPCSRRSSRSATASPFSTAAASSSRAAGGELAGNTGVVRLELDDWAKAAAPIAAFGATTNADQTISIPAGADVADLVASLVHAGVRGAGRRADPPDARGNLPANGRSPMSLLIFQIRNELMKLFARKRTYIGFGAFSVRRVDDPLSAQPAEAQGRAAAHDRARRLFLSTNISPGSRSVCRC